MKDKIQEMIGKTCGMILIANVVIEIETDAFIPWGEYVLLLLTPLISMIILHEIFKDR